MLQLKNISLNLGGKTIYKNLNLTINDGIKYALIGANGSGKTSLFRLINKEIEAEKGDIIIPQDSVIGYLPQDVILFGELTVWEIANEAFAEVDKIKAIVNTIETELENAPHDETMNKKLNKLQHMYDRLNWLNAHRTDGEIGKVLTGLGFTENDFYRKIEEFSGGWQMRAFLAKLLLEDPDYLLLDEPTNHLDIMSLQWLENFLKNYSGAVILITHDRYFIDKLSTKILHVDNETINEYNAPYDKFEETRENNYTQWVAAYEGQQRQIKELERFIERFRYKATKARQAQSRVKELEKLERISEPYQKESKINLNFPLSRISYKDVFKVKDLWFKYDKEWIIKKLELNIYRGEKIAVIGPNGAGKTTLLKLMAEFLNPVQGEIKQGERLDIGFYAQHQIEQLNLSNNIFDELIEIATPETRINIRSILGAFLFHDEEQMKKISVLSGGEKARVALAKILVQPFNCLIMDEPTNHLDMQSREILLEALNAYQGTVIIVSHDRKFIDRFARKTVFISSKHEIKEYPGNYSDFIKHFNDDEILLEEKQTTLKKPKEAVVTKYIKSDHQKRKELNRKWEKISKDIENLEASIADKENKQIEISGQLVDSASLTAEELHQISNEFSLVETELEEANEKWLLLMEEKELLENELN